ncbi:Methyltransferase domain-containing protein [Desulfonatronum zhilinae]|nr:Methyltransferase domain-containing protein [Desulfonatronum zhilinae]
MQCAFSPMIQEGMSSSPADQLAMLKREAEKTLLMISPYLRPGMRVLEIGGGIGLTYAALLNMDIDVTSLEPGDQGFGDRHRAGFRFCKILGVDPRGWVKAGIEEYPFQKQGYDLVFSFFVLEHIQNLNQAFRVMAGNLRPKGVMVHRCPNYSVPFEPHFNIPLVPFFPRWTAHLRPWLRKSPVWNGLRFTTTGGIKRLCARHGLRPVFRKGLIATALEQVLDDPLFASRKRMFIKSAGLLRKTKLLVLLHRTPAAWNTPMEFLASKV